MNYNTMSISQLAAIVEQDWKKVSPYARPYLEAMFSLKGKDDMYGHDKADSIVLYFLCNASAWRGEVAKSVKAALKKIAA